MIAIPFHALTLNVMSVGFMARAREDLILRNLLCPAVLVLTPVLLNQIRQFVSIVLTLRENLPCTVPKHAAA